MTEPPQVGDLVQEAAAGTTRPWVRLALAQVVLTVLAMLITVGLLLWVVDYLGDAKTRDEAIADIVAAFADLATADTPAEQRHALERIDEARRRLPEDNPVRRQLERPPTTQGSEGQAPPTTAVAAPGPDRGPETGRGSPTSTTAVSTSSTTTSSSTTAPLLTVDPPPIGPIDLAPVTVPCLGFVCRMVTT